MEVSFQKASIINLIYTKYSIYERRKKGQARGHDIWFYLNKPLISARIIVTFTHDISEYFRIKREFYQPANIVKIA